ATFRTGIARGEIDAFDCDLAAVIRSHGNRPRPSRDGDFSCGNDSDVILSIASDSIWIGMIDRERSASASDVDHVHNDGPIILNADQRSGCSIEERLSFGKVIDGLLSVTCHDVQGSYFPAGRLTVRRKSPGNGARGNKQRD